VTKKPRRNRWWKVLGVAAFVGVAATGVVIARAERRRRAYTPEEIRERLRERVSSAS
jgi:cytochrome c-type biogenesis protein CcmE